MKAAQINEYGDASVITLTNDAPKPEPTEGQVLLAVHAASINPIDYKVRRGDLKDHVPLQFPITLGGDVAGEIVGVGAGVTGLHEGDKVYGQANVLGGGSGALAEFATTKASQLAAMPAGLNFEEAASLPLTGQSALQVLTNLLAVQAGQKLLVQGGAGGIGSMAVQIAKHLGAYVAATAATESVDYVTSLGADMVVDYKTQDAAGLLHDYNAVFDTVGGDTYAASFAILKKGGIIASMVMPPNEALAREHGVTAKLQSTKTTTESLQALSKLVADGVIKPHIDKTYSINDIQQAFTELESGTVRGKVVLKIA